MARHEVRKVSPGEFKVFTDGKETDIFIWNGSMGLSGRGANTYGVKTASFKITWAGSLQDAKKLGLLWAAKRSESAAAIKSWG